ncbi:MAG: hypothetical protein Q8R88_12170 [Desulfoprunum sp.]|nr:hypothetical protein [Desulfoprunum sp.]
MISASAAWLKLPQDIVGKEKQKSVICHIWDCLGQARHDGLPQENEQHYPEKYNFFIHKNLFSIKINEIYLVLNVKFTDMYIHENILSFSG